MTTEVTRLYIYYTASSQEDMTTDKDWQGYVRLQACHTIKVENCPE